LKVATSFSCHAGWVTSCAWGPDCRELLSASVDGSVLISRRVFGGGLLPRASVSFAPAQALCASWLPDGRVLVGGSSGLFVLWDPASKLCSTIAVDDSATVCAIVVSQEGRALGVVADGRVLSWSAANAEPEVFTALDLPAPLADRGDDARGVWCASAFGPQAIALGSTAGVAIWDVKAGRVRARLPTSGSVYSVCAVELPERMLLCAGVTSGYLNVSESCGLVEGSDCDSS
jgi:WD40 repeat protein